jgi:hypothetical protein
MKGEFKSLREKSPKNEGTLKAGASRFLQGPKVKSLSQDLARREIVSLSETRAERNSLRFSAGEKWVREMVPLEMEVENAPHACS